MNSFLPPYKEEWTSLCASIECQANGNVRPHILGLWTKASELHQLRRMAFRPSTKKYKFKSSKVPIRNCSSWMVDLRCGEQSVTIQRCQDPAKNCRSWMANVPGGGGGGPESAIAVALLSATELHLVSADLG